MKRKGKSSPKNVEISRWKAHTNAQKFNWNILTIIDVFFDQKRVNVLHLLSSDRTRLMYSIITIFWSRKTSVIVKILQLSFCVFVCAFRPVRDSYFHIYIHTYTQTHTHTYIYIYMCMCVYVCMYLCVSTRVFY